MGTNIEYDYSFCPPGLAMAIGKLGAIEDIPTWNLQKAAFCSIDQLGGGDHSKMIDEFIAVAEDAGHKCGEIYSLEPLNLGGLGRPDNKLAFATSETELHPAVEEFRKQQQYEQPKRLEPAAALQFAEKLFNGETENAALRLAFLEEARLLAVQAKAASLAEDVICEMDIFGDVERAVVTCGTFNAICRQELDASQSRQLIERSLGFLNSSLAKSAKQKLKARLKERLSKIAERYEMTDALRRLKQVEV